MSPQHAIALPLTITLLIFPLLLFSEVRTTSPQSPNVVLMAQGRSGSTWLSSFFSGQPNVLYFNEPCSVSYQNVSDGDIIAAECVALIRQLFSCDFSSVNLDRKFLSVNPGIEHWGNTSDVSDCKDRIKVVKEIRLGSLLLNGLDMKGLLAGLKTVVLFRDPRGTISSRKKAWGSNWANILLPLEKERAKPFRHGAGYPYTQSAASTCVEYGLMRDICAYADSDLLCIDYMDMRRKPAEIAERLFALLDLSLPDDVQQHIKRYTSGDCVHKNEVFSICKDELREQDDQWKSGLIPCEVSVIQKRCAPVLSAHNLPIFDISDKCSSSEENELLQTLAIAHDIASREKPSGMVQVTFRNRRAESVRLHWIEGFRSREDVHGERLPLDVLESGKQQTITTYHTHRFVAVSETVGDVLSWRCDSGKGLHQIVEISKTSEEL